MLFAKPARTIVERINVSDMAFLGEQVGEPENIFKRRVSNFLMGRPNISRAYLARGTIAKQTKEQVFLLISGNNADATHIAEEVGMVFAGVFNSYEELRIIFLNEQNEKMIRQVCPPFFIKLGK